MMEVMKKGKRAGQLLGYTSAKGVTCSCTDRRGYAVRISNASHWLTTLGAAEDVAAKELGQAAAP